MKRMYTLACAVALGVAAMAQGDLTKVEKIEKYSVQTNGFWDNWFIGANFGGQMYVGDAISLGSKGKLITPVFEVNVGKWFTPAIGLRLGFGGYQGRGFSNYNSEFAYKQEEPGVFRTKWGNLQLHGDVMVNLTDLIYGYREDRKYAFIPYASIGYTRNTTSKDNELYNGLGLINRFRINDTWDVNVEARGSINYDGVDGLYGGKNYEGSFALMAGVTYRLGKKNWEKGSGISVAEMQEVQRKLQDMSAQNEQLNRNVNELNEALKNRDNQLRMAQEAVKGNKDLNDAMEYTAFFEINKAYLSQKEVVNLEAYANLIKMYPNAKFSITGYADKQTGPARFNEKISKLRAEAVYNTLVDKFGVNADQLSVDYKGGVDYLHTSDAKLSRAAIIRLVK